MNTYIIVSLIISIILILWLLAGYIRAVRNYRNLIIKNNELEKFKGYKEEVIKLKNNIINNLPMGLDQISTLMADLNKYLEILEADYRCYGRYRFRARVWNCDEVQRLRDLSKENKTLQYKLEISEKKYSALFEEKIEEITNDLIRKDLTEYKRAAKDRKNILEEITAYKTQLADIKEEIVVARTQNNERETKMIDALKGQQKRLIDDISELIREKTQITKEIEELSTDVKEEILDRIEEVRTKLENEKDTPEVLKKIAKAWVDYKDIIWDRYIEHLLTKPRPISIETATEFRKKLKEFKDNVLISYKETEYKYNYLISLFPDLQEYIDGEAVLEDSNEIEEHEDRREVYLTKEEWKSLSDAEKSQLALDRYNEKRKRSKAQVGRDYEEYIAHLFRQQLKGCKITMFGEQRGLEDLGRDLIVQHRSKVYIVQCKRWSEDKVIREKHIMQLFGSTIEYCWDTRRGGIHPLDVVGKTIIPVFVSTTELSDTASRFAERLDVIVAQEQMGEYPQIKCNIGADDRKIYHLPFDQQYNSCIIDHKKGEFYAMTVAEAESKGFKRAKKHIVA